MASVQNNTSQITVDYINVSDPASASKSCCDKGGAVTPAVPGRKLRLVFVSFGLLCMLQAALNISLRLSLYISDSQTSHNESSCKSLTKEAGDLKKKLTTLNHFAQQGWVYFRPSFYYISSTKRSWQDSRNYCLRRDADLVIINSREEQNFTRQFMKFMWIGLTKRENTWEWVDGTPLTKSYWAPGEPNSSEDNPEDCAETRFYEMENSWNDEPCEALNFWICEKTVPL